jgi:hypothetical protein
MKIEGQWKIQQLDVDGNIISDSGWSNNQIQDGWANIACRLFVGSSSGSISPTSGFSHLVVGSGNESWDETPPTKPRDQNQLESELDRFVLSETDFTYLDPDSNAPQESPTRFVEVSKVIDYNRGIGDLREYGLICGDSTNVANSGTLFNWYSHTLLTKTLATPTRLLLKCRIRFKIYGE